MMMECDSTSSDSKCWVENFLSTKGNEIFCLVHEEFILDRFNLTGLQAAVPWYTHAMDVILDKINVDGLEEESKEKLLDSARHLYGLIHARYILTGHGLEKMAKKYAAHEFGTCPRVLCNLAPVLPVGLSDNAGVSSVHFYCPKCQDVYNPRSSRHSTLDGSYWGTTFPHLLLLMQPQLVPESIPAADQYVPPVSAYEPKIFGFRIHSHAKLARARRLVASGQDPNRVTEDGISDEVKP